MPSKKSTRRGSSRWRKQRQSSPSYRHGRAGEIGRQQGGRGEYALASVFELKEERDGEQRKGGGKELTPRPFPLAAARHHRQGASWLQAMVPDTSGALSALMGLGSGGDDGEEGSGWQGLLESSSAGGNGATALDSEWIPSAGPQP